MRAFLRLIFLTSLIALFTLAACGPAATEPPVDSNSEEPTVEPVEKPTAEPATDETTDEESGVTNLYVDSLSILAVDQTEGTVLVSVMGNLADGCVTLEDIRPILEEDEFVIEFHATRPEGDVMCTEALVPFDQAVTLDISDVPDGTYKVIAQDKIETFTLGEDEPVIEPGDHEIVIQLERTRCFGACPAYTVMVYEDGSIVFNGIDFVSNTGEHSATIDPDLVQQLADYIVEAGYFDLEDSYTNREATDMPSAITAVYINGETKQINHYYGDFSAPEVLTEIETRIDEVLNTERWINAEADMPVEEKTLFVGAERVECTGVGPQECYLVKETPDGEWTYFYDEINGFEWEAGFEYELRVAVTTIADPPADASSLSYDLVEVVSKTAVE